MPFSGRQTGSATSYRLSEHGGGHMLSRHFALGEFASRDGADGVLVDDALLELLEQLRGRLGPLLVTSGYRTVQHNADVGGVRNSAHTTGHAADIYSMTRSVEDVALAAHYLGAAGVGHYGPKSGSAGFVHVDVRGRSGRRWNGRAPRRQLRFPDTDSEPPRLGDAAELLTLAPAPVAIVAGGALLWASIARAIKKWG